MAADATIDIDIRFSNLPKFKTDIHVIDELLSKVGSKAGEELEKDFTEKMKTIQNIADKTKKSIDQRFETKTEARITINTTDIEKKTMKVKKQLSGLDTQKMIIYSADTEQAEHAMEKLEKSAKKTEQELDHLGESFFMDKEAEAFDKVAQQINQNFGSISANGKNATDVIKNFKSVMTDSKFGKEQLEQTNTSLGTVKESGNKVSNALDTVFSVIENILDYKGKIDDLKEISEIPVIKELGDFLSGNWPPKSTSKGVGKTVGRAAGKAGTEIVDDLIPAGKASVADEAIEAVSKLGFLGKLSKGISKALPFVGVLASATELLGKGSLSSKVGAFGGSLGGSAAGAAVGTAILPGIGTAIGAGIGGIGGTEIGKSLGKDIGKGFKNYAPNLTNMFGDIGHDISKKFNKNVGTNAKELSKNYTNEMEKLNKLALKTPKNDKELKKQKAQTAEIFADMSDSIGKYYKKKEKSSKSDYDYFVKNGLMTQKEADKALKKQKKDDDKKKKDHQMALADMQMYSKTHYANVEKIEKGGTKKLQEIAKKYGKDSKEYKKELNKELEEEQENYSKKMSKAETKLNDQISKETKIASGKQLDILQELKDHKGKLSHEEMTKAILDSKEQRDTLVKNAKKTANESISAADKKYKETVEKADKERYENGTMSKKQYDEVIKNARKERDDTIGAATKKRDESIKKANETHEEVVTQAELQAGEHKGAVDGETGEVVGSWDGMKADMGSIVEAVAHGIGKLIHSLNKDWGQGLIDYKFDAAHAQGSSGLSHDEIALVGEEGFELAHHPSQGIFPVGVGGPEIRPLQAGTSILPHHMSKEFLAMAKGLPAHKNGVMGALTGAYDWLKDKAGDVWSFVTDGAEKVYDTLADKLGVSDFLDDLGDTAGYKVAAGGVSNIKDKIIEYAQGFFDRFNEENGGGGSFDGAMADNVFKYLVDIANETSKKFGMRISSGYRAGDPYYHGKHQAVDVAYPASMNGSGQYFDPANWVFEHFADKVGYVITQGKVRDRTGQSGQPATGEWEPWPANDHYDHLHITGKLGAGDIFKAGSASLAGVGASRWTDMIKQALGMNGLPTDAAYVNAWLKQITTESGGNEKAIGGDDGVAEGKAMGLLQVKPGTFQANAFPGHGNIFAGFDNMLAAIHYAKNRYGNDMLAVIGHGHGYANGGEVNGPELAWIGEDPSYAKEFIINPAKPSADSLIAKAIQSREQFRPASISSGTNNQGSFLTSEISDQSLQKLSEALENRPVKVESILDGQKVSKSVDQHNGSTFRRKLYTGGRGNVGR